MTLQLSISRHFPKVIIVIIIILAFRLRWFLVIKVVVVVAAAADVYVGIYGRGADAGDAQLHVKGERCECFQSSEFVGLTEECLWSIDV